MIMRKRNSVLASLLVGVALFAATYPYYHDIYIAELFTVICVALNGFSAVLFGAFCFFWVNRRMEADNRLIFSWFIIIQAVGHSVFAMMNWGSWLFLGLSAISLILLVVLRCKQTEK